MELKEKLFDTLKVLVDNQADIRNWQIAVEQGAIIRRIYPDNETAKSVDAILRKKSMTKDAPPRSSRIWNAMPSPIDKKKVSSSDPVVIKEDEKPVKPDVLLDSKSLLTMDPGEMAEHLGGIDGLRTYAKDLGIRYGNAGKAKLIAMIKQKLGENDPGRSEEE